MFGRFLSKFFNPSAEITPTRPTGPALVQRAGYLRESNTIVSLTLLVTLKAIHRETLSFPRRGTRRSRRQRCARHPIVRAHGGFARDEICACSHLACPIVVPTRFTQGHGRLVRSATYEEL